MPERSSVQRAAASCGGPSSARQSSRASPTTTTLLSVPSPGRWRGGIHSSITSAPAMQTQRPVPMPVWRESPWWSTSHGSLPSSDRMISQALAEALRALVVDGRLAVRTRVPSERALAPELGVSRGTVSRAYDRLREDGFLVSARGAGSWLTLPDAAGPAPLRPAPAWGVDLSIAALPAP